MHRKTAVVLTSLVLFLAGCGLCQAQIIANLAGQLDICDSTAPRVVPDIPPTLVAAVSAPRYETATFTVSVAGNYNFSMGSAGAFEEFMTLYQGSYNPANPLVNALAAGGDFLFGTDPTFTVNLAAGTTYVLVFTAGDQSKLGAYTASIQGPGTASVTATTITLGCAAPVNLAGQLDICDPTAPRVAPDLPPTLLAPVSAPRYETATFTVDVAGNYNFSMGSAGAFEEFMTLYQGSYNPADPLANALVGSGNFLFGNDPTFTFNLAAGTTYVLVFTAGDQSKLGAYTASIQGPGTASVTATTITLGCTAPVNLTGQLDICDSGAPRVVAGFPPVLIAAVPGPLYETATFTVTVGGNYNFSMGSAGAFEEFMVLYQGSYNPANPLANVLAASGDVLLGTDPTFTVSLAAGTTYVIVFTASEQGKLGAYTASIQGPGTANVSANTVNLDCRPMPPVIPVPTLNSWGQVLLALLLLAAALVAAARQGRGRKS